MLLLLLVPRRRVVLAARLVSRRFETTYLHVAPDGDCWTSPKLFAAKHLPEDFVVSLPVAPDFDADALTEEQRRIIYDTKALPAGL